MKVLGQTLRWCPQCGRKTMQYRAETRMSWVVHILLAIVTAGAWLAVWLVLAIWHLLTKPVGGAWTCSVCACSGGTLRRSADASKPIQNRQPRHDPRAEGMLYATLAILAIIGAVWLLG